MSDGRRQHPLAEATARAHAFDDAIAASQAEGEALDARIAALSALTEPTLEARAELWGLAQAVQVACTHQEPGATVAFWNWYRSSIGRIRNEAERLFGHAAWVRDIRGPNFEPLGVGRRRT